MKRWIFSIFVAMAMMVSIPASASAFEKMYSTYQPAYDTVVFTADTADPTDTVIAKKLADDALSESIGAGSAGRAIIAYTVLSPDKKETTCLHYESQPLTVDSKIPIAI